MFQSMRDIQKLKRLLLVVQPMLESGSCCTSGVRTGLVERREWKVRVGAEGLIPALLLVSPLGASQKPVLMPQFAFFTR